MLRRTCQTVFFPLLILTCFLLSLSGAQKPTAKTFFDIGLDNSNKMEYSEAIDSFEHAIKLNPQYAAAHLHLGHAYYSLHRYEEARDAYRNAVKADPGYLEALMALGSISSMLGQYDEAVSAVKAALEIDPRNGEIHFTLGNLYSEMERYEEAASAYKSAVKFRPDYAEAHYNLGVTYVKLNSKRLERARQQLRILMNLDKDLAEELGRILEGK